MNKLRKQFIDRTARIPLTFEESQKGNHWQANPTWLIEHRSNPDTHPHANPVLNPCMYHLHVKMDFFWHWSSTKVVEDSNGMPSFYGYNPSFEWYSDQYNLHHIDQFFSVILCVRY